MYVYIYVYIYIYTHTHTVNFHLSRKPSYPETSTP